MPEPTYKGPFGGSLTRSGHPIDQVKSLLQKAIRRGLRDTATAAALQLYEFMTIPGARGIVSNMLNRLIVCAGEDIGIGCIDLLQHIDQQITEIRTADYETGRHLLVKLVAAMCRATKSRLVSHTRACFYFPVFAPHIQHIALRFVPQLNEAVLAVEAAVAAAPPAAPQIADMNPEDLLAYRRFVVAVRDWRVLPGSTRYLGVRYALQLHASNQQYKIERGWPKKRCIASSPVFFAWNWMLAAAAGAKEAIEICYKWYLNENENGIYLMLAVCIMVTPELPRCVIYPRIDTDGAIAAAMEPMDMPDWAVDKHTEAGRAAGKTAVDFAHEGSRVLRGWSLFPELEKGYIEIRSAM